MLVLDAAASFVSFRGYLGRYCRLECLVLAVFEASYNGIARIDRNEDDRPPEKVPSFIHQISSIAVERAATRDDRVSVERGNMGNYEVER